MTARTPKPSQANAIVRAIGLRPITGLSGPRLYYPEDVAKPTQVTPPHSATTTTRGTTETTTAPRPASAQPSQANTLVEPLGLPPITGLSGPRIGY